MWLLLACAGGSDTAQEDGGPVAAVHGPDIDIDPLVVEVGTLDPGEVVNASLSISNLGDADLELTAMTLDAPIEGLDGELLPVSLYIVPGSVLSLLFQVGPSASGSHAGFYTVRSNDPDEPMVTVEVQWSVSGG